VLDCILSGLLLLPDLSGSVNTWATVAFYRRQHFGIYTRPSEVFAPIDNPLERRYNQDNSESCNAVI
jgi:hypothetical protein